MAVPLTLLYLAKMDKPIKLILLVDDDEATNFLHKIMINDAGCAQGIHVAKNGKEAIEYLTNAIEGKYPQPDLIFLDINMPVMNGWEFLDEYQKLSDEQKAKMVLVMLTTSINPDDYEKSKDYPDVAGFRNKPLSADLIKEIVQEHFNDNLV